MRPNTTLSGQRGEREAEEFLRREGYEILHRNYRTAHGEIDLIAVDGSALVFVEVKRRGLGAWGSPETAVNREKQRRLYRTALAYLVSHRMTDRICRFDVVGIQGDRITLIRDAFQIEG
jgi:putative endonuclease